MIRFFGKHAASRPLHRASASAASLGGKKPKRRVLAATTHEERVRFWVLFAVGSVIVLGVFFWYTSARVLGEPIVFDYGPDTPEFRQTMGPVLSAEFVDGNTVTPLINGDAFFPEMLKAIRSAKKTITLETYIWAPGKVSDEFMAALGERARAGVHVHVLVDGMGTLKLTHAAMRQSKADGVEFFKFGREHWYVIKPNINHRTHRKILVVDGRIGFTGGMCIDDKWQGNADSKDVWRETVVRVEGPGVRQMQAVFASNWLKTTSRLLVGPDYFPSAAASGSSALQCVKSGPTGDRENARAGYLLAIAAARTSIEIENPYFVPDDLSVDMLIAAARRQVKIEVIVPAINDSRFGRAASRSRWGRLLDAGVKIYQYEPAMLHCKVMMVDGVFVSVGSSNFDNRSFSLNDEVNLDVLDRSVAAQFERTFAADRNQSTELTSAQYNARPTWQKCVDKFCGMFRSQL